MKDKEVGFRLFIALGFVLALAGCSPKSGKEAGFLKEKRCTHDLNRSVQILQKIIRDENLTLFSIIDHRTNARNAKLDLKPNTTVVFGNPKVGTKLMECNPTMGLDLPLRINFYTDYEGITTLVYTNPSYWSLKHNIKDKTCLEIIRKLSIAMDMLTDKVAKP